MAMNAASKMSVSTFVVGKATHCKNIFKAKTISCGKELAKKKITSVRVFIGFLEAFAENLAT